jgi:hypothetical protein
MIGSATIALVPSPFSVTVPRGASLVPHWPAVVGPVQIAASAELEHFRAQQTPVRVKKMR